MLKCFERLKTEHIKTWIYKDDLNFAFGGIDDEQFKLI